MKPIKYNLSPALKKAALRTVSPSLREPLSSLPNYVLEPLTTFRNLPVKPFYYRKGNSWWLVLA